VGDGWSGWCVGEWVVMVCACVRVCAGQMNVRTCWGRGSGVRVGAWVDGWR
jgi:hypothetical protein